MERKDKERRREEGRGSLFSKMPRTTRAGPQEPGPSSGSTAWVTKTRVPAQHGCPRCISWTRRQVPSTDTGTAPGDAGAEFHL